MAALAGTFDLGRLRAHLRRGAPASTWRCGSTRFALGSERYDVRPEPDPGPARRRPHDRGGLRAAAALRGHARGPVHALPRARVAGVRRRRPRGLPARRGGGAREPVRRRRGRAATCTTGRATRSCSRCRRRSSAVPTAPACAPSAAPTSTTAGPDHAHERAPDPRWDALKDLDLGEKRAVWPVVCTASWPSRSRSSRTRARPSAARSTSWASPVWNACPQCHAPAPAASRVPELRHLRGPRGRRGQPLRGARPR